MIPEFKRAGQRRHSSHGGGRSAAELNEMVTYDTLVI